MASLIEVLDRARLDIIKASVEVAGGKVRGEPKPLEVKHPGRQSPESGRKKRTNWAEVAAFFGQDGVHYHPRAN